MKSLEKIKELSAQELAGKFSASSPGDNKKFLLIYSLAKEDDFYDKFDNLAKDSFYDEFDIFVHNTSLLEASNNSDDYKYPEK